MVPDQFLKSLRIGHNSDGGVPTMEDMPEDPAERRHVIATARAISKLLDRMKLAGIYLEYKLQEARIVMQDPPAERLSLVLTRCPEPDWSVSYGTLGLDREFDPVKLLDLPHDAEVLGEFAIECWDWAIRRLEPETDIPAEFLRAQLEAFRRDRYTLSNQLNPVPIAGSKCKARVFGDITCASSVIKVEVAYRKKPLFERVIWDVPEQGFNVAYEKRDCVVEDGFFKVRPAGTAIVPGLGFTPEVCFPLDSLPEAFLETLI